MSTLDGGRRSIRPGSWFGVFGERATVVLPPTEKARVAALWEMVDDGAGFDEVLDALIAGGLRELPGFALVSDLDGTTKVVLRGAASATFVSAGETVELDGASATTWVERSLPEVSSMRLVLESDDEEPGDPDLLIADGLARVASVSVPASVPALGAPMAAEAAEQEADQPTESMADDSADIDDSGDPGDSGNSDDTDDSADEPAPDAGVPAETEAFEVADPAAEAGVGAGPGGLPADLVGPDADTDADGAQESDSEAPSDEPMRSQDQPGGWTEQDDQEAVPTEPAPAGSLSLDKEPAPPTYVADEQPPSAPDFGQQQPPAWPAPEPEQQQGQPPQPSWDQPQQPEPPAWQPQAAPSNPWANPPQDGGNWAPSPDQGQGQGQGQSQGQSQSQGGVDHDGMTRAGDYDPAEFARQPAGIPGQPQAPQVTAQPVARLAFSHGESVDVDRVIIVGRAPEARRFTSTEQPRLVTVPSPNQEISSTHLEVRPGSGADHGTAVVTDLGSTNGTVLLQPGLPPEELNPGIAVQLIPGAVIDLGDGLTIQVAPPG